jgi:hypothetical protein
LAAVFAIFGPMTGPSMAPSMTEMVAEAGSVMALTSAANVRPSGRETPSAADAASGAGSDESANFTSAAASLGDGAVARRLSAT